MKLRLRQRYRYLRIRSHAWLRRHPRARAVLDASGCLRSNPRSLARGVFVGLLIALTPTVGAQTILLLSGCVLLRANFPAGFAVSWVCNPFTIAPLYWLYHVIGNTLFGELPVFNSDAWYLRGIGDDWLLTMLGSFFIALPTSLTGYFLSLRLSILLQARRREFRAGA